MLQQTYYIETYYGEIYPITLEVEKEEPGEVKLAKAVIKQWIYDFQQILRAISKRKKKPKDLIPLLEELNTPRMKFWFVISGIPKTKVLRLVHKELESRPEIPNIIQKMFPLE